VVGIFGRGEAMNLVIAAIAVLVMSVALAEFASVNLRQGYKAGLQQAAWLSRHAAEDDRTAQLIEDYAAGRSNAEFMIRRVKP
jgi:hypothetical protein